MVRSCPFMVADPNREYVFKVGVGKEKLIPPSFEGREKLDEYIESGFTLAQQFGIEINRQVISKNITWTIDPNPGRDPGPSLQLAAHVVAVAACTDWDVSDDFSCTGMVEDENIRTVGNVEVKTNYAFEKNRKCLVVPKGNLEEASKARNNAVRIGSISSDVIIQGVDSLWVPSLWALAFIPKLAESLGQYQRDLSFAEQYRVPEIFLKRGYKFEGTLHSYPVTELLDELEHAFVHALTGIPGIGKSTIAGWLCSEAQKRFREGKSNRLVLLIDVRSANLEGGLYENAKKRFKSQFPDAPTGLFELLWKLGGFLCIVDTFELHPEPKKWIGEALEDLNRERSNRFLFIGRSVAIEEKSRLALMSVTIDPSDAIDFAVKCGHISQAEGERFIKPFILHERRNRGRPHPLCTPLHLPKIRHFDPKQLPGEGGLLQKFIEGELQRCIDDPEMQENVLKWLRDSAIHNLSSNPASEQTLEPSIILQQYLEKLYEIGLITPVPNSSTYLFGHRAYMECIAASAFLNYSFAAVLVQKLREKHWEPVAAYFVEWLKPEDAVGFFQRIIYAPHLSREKRLNLVCRCFNGLPTWSPGRRALAPFVTEALKLFLLDCRPTDPFYEVPIPQWQQACKIWLQEAKLEQIERMVDFCAESLHREGTDWGKLSALMRTLGEVIVEAIKKQRNRDQRKRMERLTAIAWTWAASADRARDEWEGSIEACEEAVRHARKCGDAIVHAATLNLFGTIAYEYSGEYRGKRYDRRLALKLFYEAEKILRNTPLPHSLPLYAAVLNNLGVVYEDLDLHAIMPSNLKGIYKDLGFKDGEEILEKAQFMIEEMISQKEEERERLTYLLAYIYNNLGYARIDRPGFGREMFEKALCLISEKDHQLLSYIYCNLSAEALMRGTFDENALKEAEHYLGIADHHWHYTHEEYCRIALDNNLGILQFRKNTFEGAREFFKKALDKAKKYDEEEAMIARTNLTLCEGFKPKPIGKQFTRRLIGKMKRSANDFKLMGIGLYKALCDWYRGEWTGGKGGKRLIQQAEDTIERIYEEEKREEGFSVEDIRPRYTPIPSLATMLTDFAAKAEQPQQNRLPQQSGTAPIPLLEDRAQTIRALRENKGEFIKQVCQQCSHNCCTYPISAWVMNRAEAERISHHVGLALEEFLEDPEEECSEIKQTPEGYCVFWDPLTRLCSIQATGGLKPWDCRAFPADLLLSEEGHLEWIIYKWCPLWLTMADKEMIREALAPLEEEVRQLIESGDVEGLIDFVNDVPIPESKWGILKFPCEIELPKRPCYGAKNFAPEGERITLPTKLKVLK